MKKFYPGQANSLFARNIRVAVLSVVLLLTSLASTLAQGLVFANPLLVSGIAGQDGAVYRFPLVGNNLDALVKINARSSSMVSLVSIDLNNTGFGKAFQPQVAYNGGTTPSGTSDWWMEFTITFVTKNTTNTVNVDSFMVTGLDIDGNADKINEHVCFYGFYSHTFEAQSSLQYNSLYEMVNNTSTAVGKRFDGPVTNYVDIDTAATNVMVTAQYFNTNIWRMRVGGHSTGVSGASERMYSFWFRSFDYQAPVELRLPVTLKSFTANLINNKPVLQWEASAEKNFSHYIVQRSTNGSDYQDAVMLFPAEGSVGDSRYSYTDQAAGIAGKAVVYYRLKMVDLDGAVQYSATRLVKLGEWNENVKVLTYPNPATTSLRVTIPASWQQKKIQYDIYNAAGQLVKQQARPNANQTEMIDVAQLMEGMYILRVTAGNEIGVQRFIKGK